MYNMWSPFTKSKATIRSKKKKIVAIILLVCSWVSIAWNRLCFVMNRKKKCINFWIWMREREESSQCQILATTTTKMFRSEVDCLYIFQNKNHFCFDRIFIGILIIRRLAHLSKRSVSENWFFFFRVAFKL